MSAEPAIELLGIRKTFGSVEAVKSLDLTVRQGSITGLLGPNGSGKTTTMRMVLSILMPDSGSLRVLGRPSALESKHRVGYLPEDRGLYKHMKVGAFLHYMARLRGMPADGLDDRIRDWLQRMDLPDKFDAKCGDISRGQQQRVQAISALIHEPDLLILDEPFSGLDPVNRRNLAEIFKAQHARGCTLIVSTHMMQHAEEICDHIVMMDRGEKVVDAPLEQARKWTDGASLWCQAADPNADWAPVEALDGVARLERESEGVRIVLTEGQAPHAALAAVVATLPMERIEVERLSLEELFVRTVAKREAS